MTNSSTLDSRLTTRRRTAAFVTTNNILAKRDLELATRDLELAKRDILLAKRYLELAKRDLELSKRNIFLAKRVLELAKRVIELAKRNIFFAKRYLEFAARGIFLSARGWRMRKVSRKSPFLPNRKLKIENRKWDWRRSATFGAMAVRFWNVC